MDNIIRILFTSLKTGSIYALAALGIVLIFRTSKTTNFAQGSIGSLGAYVAATLFLSWGWNIWFATLGALLSAFAIGVLIDTLIIRPASKASAVSKQIITLGIIMVIIGLIPIFFGIEPLRIPEFFTETQVADLDIMGFGLSFNTIFIIITSVSLMGFLFWFLQYTKWGLAIRVTAASEVTSRLMGVPTKTVTMVSWATAAMVGTLAAIMLAPTASVNAGMLAEVQVNAFFAGVLGGFSTFHGPVLASYIIAFSKTTTKLYISDIWGDVIVYVLILGFLFIKPLGLFGKKIQEKV